MDHILQLLIDRIATPIGEMLLVADAQGSLRALDWVEYEPRTHQHLETHYGRGVFHLEPAHDPHGFTTALQKYFAGELHAIDSLPIHPAGTPFQQQVWCAIRSIPCGTTISYALLARQIGRPTAVRAVGLANGSNPLPIVVPCHRVIGSNGNLTGYGGGMERKRWLLDHEKQPGQLL